MLRKWIPGWYLAPDGDGAGGAGGAGSAGAAGASGAPGSAGGEGGDSGTGDATGAGTPNGGAVEFTPDQQKHIDGLIKDRLARAQTQWKTEQEQNAQKATTAAEEARLKEQAEWKKLAEKQEKELTTLQAEKAARELAELRQDVARAAGLMPELAKRLQGATREEMEADAKELARLAPMDRRLAIALEVGLPREHAPRVQGAMDDEMRKDAQALLKLLGNPRPGSPTGPARAGRREGGDLSDERKRELEQRYRLG